MGWRTAVALSRILAGQLVRGQTNFLKMLFRFSKAYNVDRFYADHFKEVQYSNAPPLGIQTENEAAGFTGTFGEHGGLKKARNCITDSCCHAGHLADNYLKCLL